MTQNDLARCSVDGTDPFGLELPRLYVTDQIEETW